MSLGYSPQDTGTTTDPQNTTSNNWSLCYGDTPCLRATRATVLLVKGTEKITVGSPLTIFVPHAEEAILNSHHIQHFSASNSHLL